ncbi:MAG TPA: AI-2E family transporter [Acidimicrobiia bacterium]|nr:AI-2E family transporter [Acidimicrobiia bacterium]
MARSQPAAKRPASRRAAPARASRASSGASSRRRAATTVEVPPVPADEPGANGGPRSPDTEIPPWVRKAIALFFAWAVGLGVAYWALNRLRSLLLMGLVALFLSLALEPPVNALVRRGWRRPAATGLVVGAFVVVTIGFFAAFGSVAFTQASALVNDTPRYVHHVVQFLNRDFGTHINANSLIRDLESKNGAVHQFGQDLANSAGDVALTIGKALLQIVVTFVFALYLTADGPRFRRAILSRLSRQHQEIVLDTWELAFEKTGAYLYSRTIQAAVCTVTVWLFFVLLGIPSALALAIWVGVVSQFIPTAGTYIALVLPVLVTLVNDPTDTIWVLAFLVGYQQFENYYLGPRIARYTLKIHPALTIGTVFAGALLLGPVGALLALPATAVVQALVSSYTEEQEVIETHLTARPQAKRGRRFRIPAFSLRRRAEPPPAPPRKRRDAGDTGPAGRAAKPGKAGKGGKRPEKRA